MRPLPALSVLALFAPARALAEHAQAPFGIAASEPNWSFARPSPANATANLIFDTVRSLLQHWPNTRYRNGHTIVPGVVPPGTLLYHGTNRHALPAVPEWTATDPEHSLLFCRALRGGGGGGGQNTTHANTTHAEQDGDGCWHLTLAATRALKVLYFDGSSAAKMRGGPMDSQDVVAWGKVDEDRVFAERARIDDLCAWAGGVGVDGFVRMEMDFEIMLCDFTAGVEVVSFLNLAPPPLQSEPLPPPPPSPPSHPTSALPSALPSAHPSPAQLAPQLPGAPIGPDARVLEAGSWHNAHPGDARVRLDYTRLLTLYDPALAPSLVRARAGAPRLRHRLAGLSAGDVARVRGVLGAEVRAWVREVDGGVGVRGGGGVDWSVLFNTIAERYAARLEVLAHVLNTTRGGPGRAHRHVRGMIAPYVLHDAAPPPAQANASRAAGAAAAEEGGKHAWAAGVHAQCATAHTAPIARRADRLTRGERVLLRAAEEVSAEICRVLVGVWAEGVERGVGADAMGAGTGMDKGSDKGMRMGMQAEEAAALVARWREQVAALMAWLDWSGYWLRCRPACGFEEICMLPTWPFFTHPPGRRAPDFMEKLLDVVERRAGPEENDWEDPQPYCLRIVEPLPDEEEI